MKRFISLLLLLALLPLQGAFCCAEEESEALPRLYSARTRISAKAFESVDKTQGINHITSLPQHVYVYVHALDPTFAYVTSARDENITGYVKRVCLEWPKVKDETNTPPYGVEFNHYITSVAADAAPVLSEMGSGETLVTLYKGAKISIIGFENGYAKLIFHRQYAYIDSNLLESPVPVYYDPESAGTDAPIAAYTSFYKLTDDEANISRMKNIDTACAKLNAITLHTGDELNFNRDIGPYSAKNGYFPAPVLVNEGSKLGYGGGTCQVASTLYNVVLQLPGLEVLQRRAHGNNGASYLPIEVDAAVGNKELNFRYRNRFPYPVRVDASAKDGALTMAIYRAE